MLESTCFIFSRNYKSLIYIQPLIRQGYTVYFNGITSLWKRIIRKICKKYRLYWKIIPFFLWGMHYKEIVSFTYIIVFCEAAEEYFCNFIEHNFPSKKLILYSCDTIRNKEVSIKKINTYKNSKWQIYSFDEQDCLTFQLKYNPFFFIAQYLIDMTNYDYGGGDGVYFIGLSKDRKERLRIIKEKLDEMNIKNKITVIDSSEPGYLKHFIPYDEVLIEVLKAEILLEIVREGQSGATQRELEAVFFKKKLITDNQYIKNRDYYNDNNVFIIDWSKKDIFEGINAFLTKPFEEISKEIMAYYTIENWLSRFMI